MEIQIQNELGTMVLTQDVLMNVIGRTVTDSLGPVKENTTRGVRINKTAAGDIDIDLHVTMAYGMPLRAAAMMMRDAVRQQLLDMTGVSVQNINIFIEGVRLQKESA